MEYKTCETHPLLTNFTQRSVCILSTDVAALRVFEIKVLRKICGPRRVGDDFRIQYNSVLYEQLNDMAVVQRINIQRQAGRNPLIGLLWPFK